MSTPAPPSAGILGELRALDERVYAAVASSDTPSLDAFFRRLSRLADKSVLWLGVAGALAVAGGPTGRRAAVDGVAAIGMASATANLVGKQMMRRRRPDRAGAGVPADRQVSMPTSSSFPSGHTASAVAFTEAVSHTVPALGVPLRLVAVAVAYSRVHTGVHYPADVLGGALIGLTTGEAAPRATSWARRRWDIP